MADVSGVARDSAHRTRPGPGPVVPGPTPSTSRPTDRPPARRSAGHCVLRRAESVEPVCVCNGSPLAAPIPRKGQGDPIRAACEVSHVAQARAGPTSGSLPSGNRKCWPRPPLGSAELTKPQEPRDVPGEDVRSAQLAVSSCRPCSQCCDHVFADAWGTIYSGFAPASRALRQGGVSRPRALAPAENRRSQGPGGHRGRAARHRHSHRRVARVLRRPGAGHPAGTRCPSPRRAPRRG